MKVQEVILRAVANARPSLTRCKPEGLLVIACYLFCPYLHRRKRIYILTGVGPVTALATDITGNIVVR